METIKQSLSTPLKMGIIIGLVYCVFIFIENQFFYAIPIQFGVAKAAGYLFIVAGYFYTGYLSKKELSGYISFQECLKSILLAIAVAELIYLLFSVLYITVIDPGFIDKMKIAYLAFFEKSKMPEDQISQQMEKFNEAGKITIWSLIQTYGFSIIIDAVFAVIFAAILKKPKPSFEN
ncbi:MAG: DUF4199 domain-containing protein [Ginsengibacter sp.]